MISNDFSSFSLLMPSGRRALLLVNTLILGLSVAVGCLLPAVFLGSTASRSVGLHSQPLMVLLLLFAAIPPYIHGLSWIGFSDWLRSLGEALSLPVVSVGGWVSTLWVQTMSWGPLAVGLVWLGAASVPRVLKDAGRLMTDEHTVWQRVTLPLMKPALAAAAGLVMLMSMTDYMIPTLFQKSVYPLEIFAEYSASGNPYGAFWLSLPLIAATVVIFLRLCSPMLASGWQPDYREDEQIRDRPAWFQWAHRGAWIWGSLLLFVPLIQLLLGSGSLRVILDSVAAGRNEISVSLLTAGLAGAISLVPALGAAFYLQRCSRQKRQIWLFLLLVPLAVPPPLMGIGLVTIWNRPLPLDMYGSLAMPVMAALVRFLPLVVLVVWTHLQRLDRKLLEAVELLPVSTYRRWRKGILPLLKPGLVAGFCLMAALTLGEVGATVVVTPPGYSTLAIRIFNLLHYGAREAVAGLCLFLLSLILIFSAIAVASLQSVNTAKQKGDPHAGSASHP